MAERISPMLVVKRKEARAVVLMALDAHGGLQRPMKVGWIKDANSSKPEIAAEIPNQVYYLQSKGYVEIIEVEETPELRPILSAYIQLTAKGQDVIEGTIEDPGIVFGDGCRA